MRNAIDRPPAPAAAKPQREHALLRQFEGSWDFDTTFDTGDGEVKGKGVSIARLTYGGFWLMQHDDFQTEGGEGHGMIGFDPGRGKYVMTGICSLSPGLCKGEGEADASGKVFIFDGDWTNPTSSQLEKIRMVYEIIDRDRVTLTFHDAAGRQFGEFVYRRKPT